MPRICKTKEAPAKKEKSKMYAKPKIIKEGTISTDMPKKIKEETISTEIAKEHGLIGPSIGIYASCRKSDKSYEAVVKCEPPGYGSLFAEMHLYLRNAKLDDIKQFKMRHGLKSLGTLNGSTDRYGRNLSKNGNPLPETTVYRLTLQMLDLHQFIHGTADLQAGLGREGLPSHFLTGDEDLEPDPKKNKNGAIEYTSRDALVELPWITEKKVQKAKQLCMPDVNASLKTLYPKGVPASIGGHTECVAKLTRNDDSDYDKCRNIFINALKHLNNNRLPPKSKLEMWQIKSFESAEKEENDAGSTVKQSTSRLRRGHRIEKVRPVRESAFKTSSAVHSSWINVEKLAKIGSISSTGRTVIYDDDDNVTHSPQSTYELKLDANVILHVVRKKGDKRAKFPMHLALKFPCRKHLH